MTAAQSAAVTLRLLDGTTREVPPYSGPDTECPKCGCPAGTFWHHGLPYPTVNPRGETWDCYLPKIIDEHQCRLCGNCGYGWVEATADNSGPAAGPPLRALPGGAGGQR